MGRSVRLVTNHLVTNYQEHRPETWLIHVTSGEPVRDVSERDTNSSSQRTQIGLMERATWRLFHG